MKFENKVVVVTGGARGIGAEIVKHFLHAAAIVHILDKDIADSSIPDENDRLIASSGDVSNAEDVKSFISHVVSASGKIDVLINNAGIIRDSVIWKMEEDDFDAVMDVNLKGPWLMCREVASIMREQKSGRIVNIASRSWLGNFGQSNYSSSKGGLVSLTRVLALELARSNVTVNAVAPGLIDTPMTRSMKPEIYDQLQSAIPGGKAGTPADIANAVTFLASDEAQYITGQIIHVDGGKSIGANV